MKIIEAVSRAMGLITACMLLPLMLLTVGNVILRFAFNSPIMGTFEITELMMVALTLGFAWTGIKGRHIAVDMLLIRFPKQVQAVVRIVTWLVTLGMCLIIIWQVAVYSIGTALKDRYVVSLILPIPLFPFHWMFLLSLIVFFLVLVTHRSVKQSS